MHFFIETPVVIRSSDSQEKIFMQLHDSTLRSEPTIGANKVVKGLNRDANSFRCI